MKKKSFMVLMTAIILFCGCGGNDEELTPKPEPKTDPEPETPTTTISEEIQLADQFAYDVLSDIYLWVAEIRKDLPKLDKKTCEDPIQTVYDIRYKGDKEEDKWTMLTNDMAAMEGSSQGIETTYGFVPAIYKFSNYDAYFAIIEYVYKNSPAAKAGMKRGDIIMKLNGNDITASNYMDLYYSSNAEFGMAVWDKAENMIKPNGERYNLKAEEIYEDPVLLDSVYVFNGKKVGYLAYAAFDLLSANKLIEVSKKFKSEGIKELILDLRYNGGGYVSTEELLGSLIAPKSVVTGNEIFHTEIWNQGYMDYWKEKGEDLNTYFGVDHSITTDGKNSESVDITDANMNLSKIYAIITGGSASASEGVLVALNPYMDIDLVGEQSHGKYCTGVMLAPKHVYNNPPSKISNWGIYVMRSTFADRDGNNISRPNGLTPDLKVEDDPFDGYQLGDVRETMLAAALKRAGKVDATEKVMTRGGYERPHFKEIPFQHRKTFGMSIATPKSDMIIKR